MISFEFKPEKFASAVAYMVQQRPGLTKKQICKLLYFADKEHLLTYGRTITGDVYHALEQGHIPTSGLDMMNGRSSWVGDGPVQCLRKYGELKGNEFVLRSPPNLRVFSKSDKAVLDHIISQMGNMTAFDLEDLSHQEPSWIKTPTNRRVQFELFFEGHPEAEAVKEALLEDFREPRVA